MATILILGGNFGGMTSAFELKRKLRKDTRVVVVSKQKEFVYIPSLIWVPFGRRTLEDITARYGERTTDFVAMQLEYPRIQPTP